MYQVSSKDHHGKDALFIYAWKVAKRIATRTSGKVAYVILRPTSGLETMYGTYHADIGIEHAENNVACLSRIIGKAS